MKLKLLIVPVFLSVMSISCWQRQENKPTPLAQPASSQPLSNVVYLHQIITRGQNAAQYFNTYIQTGNIVVDFYADWCGPCKTMGRIIDQVAAQYPSITFLKVDSDQFQSISSGIRSIPTLVFYKNGTQVKRISGTQSKNALIDLLEQLF